MLFYWMTDQRKRNLCHPPAPWHLMFSVSNKWLKEMSSLQFAASLQFIYEVPEWMNTAPNHRQERCKQPDWYHQGEVYSASERACMWSSTAPFKSPAIWKYKCNTDFCLYICSCKLIIRSLCGCQRDCQDTTLAWYQDLDFKVIHVFAKPLNTTDRSLCLLIFQ